MRRNSRYFPRNYLSSLFSSKNGSNISQIKKVFAAWNRYWANPMSEDDRSHFVSLVNWIIFIECVHAWNKFKLLSPFHKSYRYLQISEQILSLLFHFMIYFNEEPFPWHFIFDSCSSFMIQKSKNSFYFQWLW
jgi:hypothetical protein